jgi:uncharacterized protein
MASKGLRIFRKWNRVLHRDIGYFFFGLTIIYCISGIAVNHKKDWNPNYDIRFRDISLGHSLDRSSISEEQVLAILDGYGETDGYKKFYFPDDNTLKVFIKDGSLSVNMETGNGYIEKISKRPFFYEINFLHYNPGSWWTWFSDAFCVGLILIAITGLFVIAKSKNSLTRRGIWFIIAGLLLPILAMFIL